MARFITNLLGLPYGDPNMTQWYTLYKEALIKMDTSLFAHRENKDLISIGGGNIAYNNVTFELSWDSQIQLLRPISSLKNSINATTISNVPFESYIYVDIKRNLKNNGGVIPIGDIKVASSLPNSDFVYKLFYITASGELITSIDNTVASTPVDNSVLIDIDKVKTKDFPHNPIYDDSVLESLIVSDVVSNNSKSIEFTFKYPSEYSTKNFKTNFIVSSPHNLNDLYYDLKISKQVLNGPSLSLTTILNASNNKTLSSVDSIVSVEDDNTFDLIPGEFYKFEISFLNDLASHLGFASEVKLYSIFLLGI